MTVQQYLSWFDEVLAPTEHMFRLVPSDKLDWKLTDNSFTLGQLLSHIPRGLSFIATVINGDEWPLKSLREIFVANRRQPSSTVDEAVASLTSEVSAFKGVVGRLGEEKFQNGMLDTPQKGRVPYWRYCAFALEHHIHHLMELHISLKVLGVKVNTGTLYVR